MILGSWKVKAIGALALVAILAGAGAGAGWWFTKTAYERDISDLKEEQTREREGWLKEKLAITTKAKLDTDAAIARMKDAQGELARIDAENQRKLEDAEQENEALRRDVAAGNRRLRLLGDKLAHRGEHPAGGDTCTGSLGDDTGVELSAAAGRTVFDIRAGIISDRAKIAYLQDYIERVVKQCKR